MPEITALEVFGGSPVGYPLITLDVLATDAAEICFSNDDATWSEWEPYSGRYYEWTLTPGDGVKTVYAKIRNASWHDEDSDTVQVVLDSSDDTDRIQSNLSAVYSRIKAGLLYELQSASATEIALFRRDLEVALSQLDLQRARGYWLDQWAKKLGVTRREDEEDVPFASRIVQRIMDAKLNGRGIRAALEDETALPVTVSEFPGYDGYLLIGVQGEAPDMDALMERIRQVKAAGIKPVIARIESPS